MWQILRIAILVVCVLPTSGHAITVPMTVEDSFSVTTPWRNPGGNPCQDSAACTATWAATAMYQIGAIPAAVRDEFLARENRDEPRLLYWVQPGRYIRVNTYAKEGVPYTQEYMQADFADGEPRLAYGHHIYHDGVWYEMVRVAECGNWILMIHQPPNTGLTTVSEATPVVYQTAGGSVTDATTGGGDSSYCVVCDPNTPSEPPTEPPVEPPQEPPIIPLPATMWLYLTALASTIAFRYRLVRT